MDRLDNAAAAGLIGISPETLYAWRVRRHGPAWSKIAGRVWYDRADVLSWIAAQRVDPSAGIAA